MKKILFLFLLLIAVSPFSILKAASVTADIITPNSQVPAGSQISFTIKTSELSGNPKYTLSDSFPGSTLSNSNISTWGQFSWNTSPLDIGSHLISINAIDSNGTKVSITVNLIVDQASPVSIRSLEPGSIVSSGKAVSFIIAAQGYINPTFSVSDSFPGSSLSNFNISTSGNFGWTPTKTDAGIHNLTIRVNSSNGRSDTLYQTITVNGIQIQNLSGNQITVGNSLSFSSRTYGLSNPSYRVTDSLRNNTIDSMIISSNDFRWTPSVQDIGSHTLAISATDTEGKVFDTNLIITVLGNTPVNPIISLPSIVATTTVSTIPQGILYLFIKNLSVGSFGKDVSELQKRLKIEGYYAGPITGTFGPLTKTAVIKYQKSKGIPGLGTVGVMTRVSLNKK